MSSSPGVSVYRGETPEDIPDGYEYVPPDEEPPEGHDVVESSRGATYVSPEPADDDNATEQPEAVARVDDIFDEAPHPDVAQRKAEQQLEEMADLPGGVSLPLLTEGDDQREVMKTLTQAASDGLLGETDEIRSATGEKQGAYTFNFKRLQINDDVTSDDLAGLSDENFAVGDSMEWLVLHELGHANHHTEIGDVTEADDYLFEGSLTTTRDGEWIGRERLEIAEDEVSEYARTNPAEFVAEVFAGLALGQEFPDEVMEMYDEFDGPDTWRNYQ